MEEWRVIEEAPRYFVSNEGRVWSSITERILKPGFGGAGYPQVMLRDGGKYLNRYVHVLVAEAFIDNRKPGFEINHIDGDKTNNFVWNLEWTTHSANLQHARSIGRSPGKPKKRIRVVETGDEFESQNACAKIYGLQISGISNCLNGIAKQHKGYTFEYVD